MNDVERMRFLEERLSEIYEEVDFLISKHTEEEIEQELDELYAEEMDCECELGDLRRKADKELMEASKHW